MLGDEYPFLSVTNGYWGVKTESARFLTHTQIGNVSENVWHSLPKRSFKKKGLAFPIFRPRSEASCLSSYNIVRDSNLKNQQVSEM